MPRFQSPLMFLKETGAELRVAEMVEEYFIIHSAFFSLSPEWFSLKLPVFVLRSPEC